MQLDSTCREMMRHPITSEASAFLTSTPPKRPVLKGFSRWVLDSGTTAHFCCDRSLLTDFAQIRPVTVRMGSATTTASAMGSAILWLSKDKTNYDQRVTLNEVLYVPDFFVNLMSVRRLARHGFGFVVLGNTAALTMADLTPFATVVARSPCVWSAASERRVRHRHRR